MYESRKPLTNTHTEPRFRRNCKAIGQRIIEVFAEFPDCQRGSLMETQKAGGQNRGYLAKPIFRRQAQYQRFSTWESLLR